MVKGGLVIVSLVLALADDGGACVERAADALRDAWSCWLTPVTWTGCVIQQSLLARRGIGVLHVTLIHVRCGSCESRVDDYLQRWAVSRRINSSKADGNDPTLVDAVRQAA